MNKLEKKSWSFKVLTVLYIFCIKLPAVLTKFTYSNATILGPPVRQWVYWKWVADQHKLPFYQIIQYMQTCFLCR